jgi:hypothetical protein
MKCICDLEVRGIKRIRHAKWRRVGKVEISSVASFFVTSCSASIDLGWRISRPTSDGNEAPDAALYIAMADGAIRARERHQC